MFSFFQKSLLNKLVVLFLAVSLIPIAIVGYMSYSSAKANLREQIMGGLETTAQSREMAIERILKLRVEQVKFLGITELVQESIEALKSLGHNPF